MAGPMVGPILERLDGLELVPTYWEPDGEFPDHEPNPLLPENREFIIRKVRDEGADLGIAWDGDADRCFFIDETGEFVRRRLPHRAAGRVGPAEAPGRGDPLRHPRLAGGRRHRRGGRRARAGEPRRPRVLQDPHARRGRRVRRRGLRPLLLRRLLQRRLRHDPGAADPRAAGPEGRDDVGAARALPREVLHLRRDQLRGRGPGREAGRDQGALRRRRPARARRHLGRLRRLALQRAAARTPSRCCASRSSRSSPRRTWRRSETRSCASSARDPHALDPDAVHGRPGQLLPDRGRPADAGRRRAELGQGARRARARAGRPRPPDRGPASGSSSPTSTSTTSAWSASSPAARRPRSARSTCSRP